MKKSKKNYSLLLGTMVVCLLSGCASQAAADDTTEAASASWTEEKLKSTETGISSAEKKMNALDKEIKELQTSSQPSFSKTPSFSDVPASHFAFEGIQFLHKNKVITGYEDGTFKPSQSINRGQTAAMLVRDLNLKAPSGYKMKAKDVRAAHPYHDELAAMEHHGIMLGSNGNMNPGEGLKRSQMAVILTRAYNLPNAGKNHSFTDITTSFPNYKEINTIADAKITTESGKAFRPNAVTNRAQFSLFVARAKDDYFK